MTRLVLLLLGIALLAPAPARAAGDSDLAAARAEFRKGAELYRAGSFREAIARFEAAYRLRPHGAVHYNVARCRERLGEWPAALRSYHDYLREVPGAEDAAQIRAAIRRLDARLAGTGVQALLVYSDPPGGEVRIDGRVRGRTPFQTLLPAGTYGVAVGLEGHATVEDEAVLAPGASTVLELALRPVRVAAAATPRPPGAEVVPAAPASASPPAPLAPVPAAAVVEGGGAPGTSASPAAGPAPGSGVDLAVRAPPTAVALAAADPDVPVRAGSGRRHVYTWVAAGTAAAAVAAGMYFGSDAKRKQEALLDGTVHPDAGALARDARSSARAANVLYGIAGGAAAAGVTLFFVEGRF